MILIVEDDLEIQSLLSAYLSQAGFTTLVTGSPSKALEYLDKKGAQIELIVLDLTLPEMDGLALCKKIRQLYDMPIIISSARGDINNKIKGFDTGADDYLAKPYEPAELIVRINARLKHSKTSKFMEFDNLKIDIESRSVTLDGEDIKLTGAEFDILVFLVNKKNKPVSREDIACGVGNIHYDSSLRSIDTHIRNIRSKLGDDVKTPKFIKSVWGIGYKFCND